MARQGFINGLSTTSYTRWCKPRGPVEPMHARALANGLKPLQHLNLLGAVGVLDLGSVAHSESLKPGTGSWAGATALNST